MNFISTQLQLFIRDSINPLKLAGQPISSGEFTKWKSFLSGEAEAVRLLIQDYAFTYHDKKSRDISGLISQIIHLSNTVDKYIGKYAPVWSAHGQAHELRLHYMFTCNLLDELLTGIEAYFPTESFKARITHFSLPQAKMVLKQRQSVLAAHLRANAIESNLGGLLLNGLLQLINKKNLTRSDAHYISEVINQVLISDDLTDQVLTDLMIILDFNLPEFFLFYVNEWEDRLTDIPGLHEQREMLLKEKNKLHSVFLKGKKGIGHKPGVLYHDLSDFLNEKYAFVTRMVKLQREAIRDMEKARSGRRFLINLPVSQFGLLIRLLIEKGILVKENVGELFSFFAANFYTANTPYISAESLQKKSTVVEFTTAQKMKGHVIGMLNWLNTNYNLSNYN